MIFENEQALERVQVIRTLLPVQLEADAFSPTPSIYIRATLACLPSFVMAIVEFVSASPTGPSLDTSTRGG